MMDMKKIAAAGCVALLLLAGGLTLLMKDSVAVGEAGQTEVVDSAGRTVTIPVRPQRVVVLNASNLEIFCAAGGAAQVVGKPVSQALPDEVMQSTVRAAEVGVVHSPDVEAILALKPDLVIGIDVPFHHALIPVLGNAGISFLIQSLDTYEQVLHTLKFYGELTGQPEQVAQKLADMDTAYKAATARADGRTSPSCLIIWGSPESFSMATEKSFVGDLARRLGAKNIAADLSESAGGFVPLSMEYVAKTNPEMIFLVTHSFDPNVETKFRQDMAEHAAWQDVRAVRDRRVYVLPYALFAVNPGTRAAEALTILADKIYAEEPGA